MVAFSRNSNKGLQSLRAPVMQFIVFIVTERVNILH
jgi:hypothetical protein